MVKIELEITDIDYDTLIERYLPLMGDKLRESGNPLGSLLSGGMSGSLARTVLQKSPQSAKDKLAADLINGSAPRLSAELEKFARQKGVEIRIGALRAGTAEKPGK